MKLVAQNWLVDMTQVNRRTVQFIVLLITLVLYVLGAGAPMDDVFGTGT